MNRLLRSVLIGGGAAAAVGGGLYMLQQQQQLSQAQLTISLSPEWNFKTRQYVVQASRTHDAATRAQHYQAALSTLVTPATDLKTKSQSWLAGYADLLRSLGLAYLEFLPEEALAPLRAAQSIPFGNPALQAEAQVGLFELTKDAQQLFRDVGPAAGGLPGSQPGLPGPLDTSADIKSWAPLLLLRAQYALNEEHDLTSALDQLLKLHQKINSQNDTLCFKAKSGGFIAQILWKLNRPSDAVAWLKASTADVKCGTPACKETRSMLDQLFSRTQKN